MCLSANLRVVARIAACSSVSNKYAITAEHTWYEPAMARLHRSAHLSWFAHMGAVYLFHDLYGYLMEMSADIADLIEAFEGGADVEQTVEKFRSRMDGADPQQFVEILTAHSVLVEPDEDEVQALWPFVPIKGKW